jgi:hypothetical protein
MFPFCRAGWQPARGLAIPAGVPADEERRLTIGARVANPPYERRYHTRMLRALAALALVSGLYAADRPLETLRREHPRLLASSSDFARLKELVKSDAVAGRMYAAIRAHADTILKQEPVVHKLIGPRLLDQSRRALDRIQTLALVYRISGERSYLARAVLEMRAAAAFPDWNPSHFLDTAEMTNALAIGYDWLYADLTADDRSVIRRAVVEKGLDRGIEVYKAKRWWTVATHNWNQVCNGGMAMGALAIADEERERAEYVVGQSIDSIRLAMNSYGPEGGWNEGPGYWQYATIYNVYYLAALDSALGTDFGLSKTPGFPQAGDFRIYFQGPSVYTFNYADARASKGPAPEMFWLARKFNQPAYAADELRHLNSGARPHALDLLWYTPKAVSAKQAGWPLNRMFRGVDVAFLRSDWEDPKALWIAVKGGDNKANHSHLDLGSFVMEKNGVRWAVDLGSDDYNMPAYFGAQRWTYYRLRTESHNTVLIDGANQDPKAAAPLQMKDGAAVIDLSRANPGKVTTHTRTTRIDGGAAIVRDEIVAPQPVEALWGMVTEAEIALDGRRATLRQGGATLTAEIASPADGVFAVVSTQQQPPQNTNLGTKKLIVRLSRKVTEARIEVRFQ